MSFSEEDSPSSIIIRKYIQNSRNAHKSRFVAFFGNNSASRRWFETN